ncbi:ATP-dependent nuclease [Flavobacterium sp. GCM10027622]|uniref:ATP-dependent nuclease n=1 Tax=unclassified Flavobacterium TaxID=196869 RepID=UPI00360B54C8
MKLKDVKIYKYKSFETPQEFELESDITVLVGMNESGKTSALESLAKTRYFQDDEDFKFKPTHDYPRKDKKRMEKANENPQAITCTYEIDDNLLKSIEKELGEGVLKSKTFTVTSYYDNSKNIGLSVDTKKFIEFKTKELGIASNALTDKLLKVKSKAELEALEKEYIEDNKTNGIKSLLLYFENKYKWMHDPIGEYVYRILLNPKMPKFLYYDEYYSLPSRISIEKLNSDSLDSSENEYKTAKALFELADINTEEILESESFEDYIAELEATEAIISEELFKYWQTNKNLSITFQIDKVAKKENRTINTNHGHQQVTDVNIVEHVLDIRVKNKGVSLPLKNRSKGFNWFFSFLVWFKKIQEDQDSNYILLLDEPGLNLHASAQADLLRFLEDLSEKYQIVYSTHSPFMIVSDKLQRVRTVLETDKGSIISNSVQEKDPNTLFPLQAALGYNIAQNLFISKKNLLVEGVSDLIYLQTMSAILEGAGKEGLKPEITIVPTGGLEKVSTFISLLRGNDLQNVSLLDSYTDPKGKAKLDNLIVQKIISEKNILFFHEFIENRKKADIEDLFTTKEYLALFNEALKEHKDIKETDLNTDIESILLQINKHLKIDRFNHYRPANLLAQKGMALKDFDKQTIDNFEKVFKKINKLFEN